MPTSSLVVLGVTVPFYDERPHVKIWRIAKLSLGTIRVTRLALNTGGVLWTVQRTWSRSEMVLPDLAAPSLDRRLRVTVTARGSGSTFDAALEMHGRAEAAVREGAR